ncbi:putative aspartate aminotransferase [Grosmannia clavigera kw1407]|uniref:Aspartate aminotransferase n=1 Tax=Grosmannia clavigera (strain kw1407 / UAMH 11150) TaxID=655863 RepID=F0X9R9_GROCL|nr:putative aspartate aminotransferase [Grosmannia clavigera kw1407]EFX05874.1 putative aspartate aminotransferase [Grosmannia clavigera kw1407]
MGSILAEEVSVFDHVDYIPPDPIFELTLTFNADKDPRKVNLGQGTYKDEHGNPWILPSVRGAKEKIRDANHEYLPILGLLPFRTHVTELVYGKDSPVVSENKVAASQSLSGTGALHLAGSVLYQTLPKDTIVYINNPTWSNHRQVFETIGFEVRDFRWSSPKTGSLDLLSILEDLSQAPPLSLIILHASGHNPSACDPSNEQWRQIATVIKDRQLLPLFDAAYLGITSGSYEADAFAIRHFVNDLKLETVICASFAKNMGLYGERVGYVSMATKTAASAKAMQSRLAQQTRAEISNPPAFGARIVAAVLADDELRAQWDRDLIKMSSRISGMRTALYEGLKKRDTPGDWKPIMEQKGMFSVLGLPLAKVMELRGLNEGNVEYVAAALDSVLR